MNPLEKFTWCVRLTRRFYHALGQNIFRSIFQYEYGFAVTALILLIGLGGCFYSMIAYDTLTAYSAAVIFGGLSQVSINCHAIISSQYNSHNLAFPKKVLVKHMLLRDLQPLIGVVEFLGYVYAGNSRPRMCNYDLCMKYAKISTMIVKLWLFMYFSNVSLYQVAAVYEYCMHGTSKPLLNMYLPLLDRSGIIGMVIIYIANILVALTACIVLYAFDALISIVFTNIPMLSTIISRKWHDMEMLRQRGQISHAENTQRFKELVMMQHKYNRYFACNVES